MLKLGFAACSTLTLGGPMPLADPATGCAACTGGGARPPVRSPSASSSSSTRCGSAGAPRLAAWPPIVVRTGSVDAIAAGVEGCSFCGGIGGAPSAPGARRAALLAAAVSSPAPAPRGPRGSSSTACSLVDCATRRRGVRREGRGPELEAPVAVDGEGAASAGLSVAAAPGSEVEDGGWVGASAQGDSSPPRGSIVRFAVVKLAGWFK